MVKIPDMAIGTVFILTSGNYRASSQLEAARSMFQEQLKFTKVIVLVGIDSDDKTSFPPGKVGPTSALAWLLAFGPQLSTILRVNGVESKEPFAIAEDSVWPTSKCTPNRLYQMYRQYTSDSNVNAVWAGAYGRPRRHKGLTTRAPYGCKLFVCNKSFINDAWNLFKTTDKSHSVDSVMQILVDRGECIVPPMFVAGTQPHWSARLRD